MRALLLFATGLFLFCFTSCSESESKNEVEVENPYNIELNEGSKWEVNSDMVEHIQKMDLLLKKATPKSVQAHTSLGQELMTHVNQLTASCTMSGKAHDELHKWLLPFIHLVEDLKTTTSIETGKATMSGLKNSMQMYHHFFE